MSTSRRNFVLKIALVLSALGGPLLAAGVNCSASVALPVIARVEGLTEPVGDFVVTCTGGTPTPAGLPVPQINWVLFLNTNATSQVTANSLFDEALLLIDEPNSPVTSPQHPLLNCGQNGAPDNGVSGPGVCQIVSDGTPGDSYDGTQNSFGAAVCDGMNGPQANSYGCGRPNAFQGRIGTGLNEIEFLGVPFDPPGGGTRTFRFTNIRANAAILNGSPFPIPIMEMISLNGPIAITITSPQQTAAFANPGLIASVPTPGVVHIQEGFASSFKDKNVSFTTGNGIAGNATFGGTSWTYNGNSNYPPDLAQNVPGVFYNTESMFQWQNNGVNGPPSPNPPPGFGFVTVANLGNPLDSLGFGLFPTGISADGVASAGTRIALSFSHLPGNGKISVPSMVLLHGIFTPMGPATGVLVLTSTDTNGAGTFTPAVGSSVPAGNLAVYEVLYADPFQVEAADIPCTFLGNGSGGSVQVTASFAPFYSSASAGRPTPTTTDPTPTAIPRFVLGTKPIKLFH